MPAAQAPGTGTGLSGVSGVAADVIEAVGEVGVGLLTLVETVFPPIPSEIVLSLAGYLAQRGQLDLTLTVVAATVGALAGAYVLYGLGHWFGEDRARSWLTRLPLVHGSDFDKASDWFRRYGTTAVLVGRCVPIVRSLVSLPAGAQGMPLVRFTLLTVAGTLVWNSALIGAGYALGTQYHRVERYAGYLDYVVYGGIVAVVGWLLIRHLRRRPSGGRSPG